MDKELFLELFKECLEEGLIDINIHKATVYYDYSRVEVKINGEIVTSFSF